MNATSTDIAWLTGMLESEGSITFQARLRNNGNLSIVPLVTLTNTDNYIISEVLRISKSVAATGSFCCSKIQQKNKYSNKQLYIIRITRMDRVYNLITAIYPYMKSFKRHNAEIVLRYIDRREENLLLRDDWGHITRRTYSESEVRLVSSIRTHHRAMPLDVMLNAPNVEKD